MKLIVGLGNPGPQYTKTRHNAGFMVIDRLCAKYGKGESVKAKFQAATVQVSISGETCLLLKPTTFMNLSGRSVGEAIRFYKADPAADLMVVVDDLYLPVGSVRIKPGGGAGGHNGLTSIQGLLGRDDYPRLRIGVGLQPSGGKPAMMDQADYVLSRFTQEEESGLESSIETCVKAVEVFVGKGLAHAMNFANATGPAAKPNSQGKQPSPEKPPAQEKSTRPAGISDQQVP